LFAIQYNVNTTFAVLMYVTYFTVGHITDGHIHLIFN